MRTLQRFETLRSCVLILATVAGIGALSLSTGRPAAAQVVYSWHPYYEFVAAGKCISIGSVCSPSTAGQRCRYCLDAKTVYACTFKLWENCYEEITNPPTEDCGLLYLGICNSAGTSCSSGVSSSTVCPRPNCYSPI